MFDTSTDYKLLIEDLLDLNLECDFEQNVFKDIYDTLVWIDYHNDYQEFGGFFKEFKELGKKRHLYLPYFIEYMQNRCARVYYLLCHSNIEDCPYGGFISMTIYEGCKGQPRIETGFMTNELSKYSDLHRNYLWGKELLSLPLNHWKRKFMNTHKCKKALYFVNSYIDLLKVHDDHLNDLGHLCLLFANIWFHFKYNKDSWIKLGFFCYYKSIEDDCQSFCCVNLQGPVILCKEFSYSTISQVDKYYEYTSCDLDYPTNIDDLYD